MNNIYLFTYESRGAALAKCEAPDVLGFLFKSHPRLKDLLSVILPHYLRRPLRLINLSVCFNTKTFTIVQLKVFYTKCNASKLRIATSKLLVSGSDFVNKCIECVTCETDYCCKRYPHVISIRPSSDN